MKLPRRRGWILSFLMLAAVEPVPAQPSEAGKSRPNILFLFADDLAVDGVRALGGKEVETPNLDRLVARGTVFTHAYNMGSWNGAVCIASRAMLMTGRSVWRAKAVSGKKAMAAEQAAGRLWPGMMAAAGYRTFMTGKWHNEIDPALCFDEVRHVRGGMAKARKEGYNRPLEEVADSWNPADPALGGFWEGGRHWTEVAAEDAMGFVRDGRTMEKPWFAYVAFNAPHDPRQSPQEFLDKYPADRITVPENCLPLYPYREELGLGKSLRDERLAPFPRTPHAIQVHRREYYAMVTHLDVWIGRILEELEKSGQAERTWICFTSDHGLALGRHGFMGKQSLYEHSTSVPLVIAGPGVAAGARIASPVYLQDAMPTLLEVAGAKVPEHVEFRSLRPLLQPDAAAMGRDVIYGTDLNQQRAVTIGGWKLLAYPPAKVLRLYQVAEDPSEMKDVAREPDLAGRVRDLFARLRAEQARLGDPLDLLTAFPEMAVR